MPAAVAGSDEGSGPPGRCREGGRGKRRSAAGFAEARAARSRCSSAARTRSSMCGRISRRCSSVPVTIAPSDRPLGTHVFTAQADKDDANVLHWSVVSLPVPARNARRSDEDERSLAPAQDRGRWPIEVKPLPLPDSPAEALDRLTLPADAMARISRSAFDRRLDHRFGSGHRRRRDRRRNGFHRFAALDHSQTSRF